MIEKIQKVGTTETRKAFWDSVSEAVEKLRKTEGHNVSVNEFQGYGTIVNVTRERGEGGAPTGACCVGETCSITTEEHCGVISGVYQGDDTTCDPNPCVTGACCKQSFGGIMSCEQLTETECISDGGVFQGVGTLCETTHCCPQIRFVFEEPISVVWQAGICPPDSPCEFDIQGSACRILQSAWQSDFGACFGGWTLDDLFTSCSPHCTCDSGCDGTCETGLNQILVNPDTGTWTLLDADFLNIGCGGCGNYDHFLNGSGTGTDTLFDETEDHCGEFHDLYVTVDFDNLSC